MTAKPEFSTVVKSLTASAKDSAREIVLKLSAAASSARGENCLGRDETPGQDNQFGRNQFRAPVLDAARSR